MRAYARPLMVNDMGLEAERCLSLEALPMRVGTTGALYDERWVQMLIQRHPTLLPMDQIEPALTPLMPVCVELPMPSGYADNLLMTPDGGIVLVETKLWRNPEARREVVGQVLDYAKDLSRWRYEDLERAVQSAVKDRAARIFHMVCGGEADADEESRFIDAVSRNLRFGRFLLIIAGDGIQESAEQLADFLQRHVGLHFTLAMVEMSLWRVPETGQVLVQPKVLTRTVQIERAVVRVEEGVAIRPASIQPVAAATAKAVTLSEETFYETLAASDPSLPDRLKSFIAALEPLGVFSEVKRSLSLKWRAPDGQTFHLGSVDLSGKLVTDYAQWSAYTVGRLDLATRYQEALAALLPGGAVKRTPKETGWHIAIGNQSPPVSTVLANGDAWARVIADYITSLEQALQEAA